MTCWIEIHDFIHGFGYKEESTSRYIWMNDVIDLFHIHKDEKLNEIYNKINTRFKYTNEELDEIYIQLEPLLAARKIARLKYLEEHPPKNFTHITIPKINRIFPTLITMIYFLINV